MDPSYEACVAGAFIDFLEKGYVYRGLKPVYWCIFDRTALAEAEVEYENHTSPSIWVKFPFVAGEKTKALGIGSRRQRPDLDHHSLDAARQSRAGSSIPNSNTSSPIPASGKLLLAKDRVHALTEELKLEVTGTEGGWKGQRIRRRAISPPVPGLYRSGSARRLRDARSGQRHRAHRSGPRRRRLPHRPEI